MAFGDVEIFPFEGGEHLAQYVAFAASVKEMGSSPDAIEAIGTRLGDFTSANQSARFIAAPLLGAGAGGIQSERVVAALRTGFTASAHSASVLVIHVLHGDVFERLKKNRYRIQEPNKRPVRVFLSHTSRTDSEVEWVK